MTRAVVVTIVAALTDSFEIRSPARPLGCDPCAGARDRLGETGGLDRTHASATMVLHQYEGRGDSLGRQGARPLSGNIVAPSPGATMSRSAHDAAHLLWTCRQSGNVIDALPSALRP